MISVISRSENASENQKGNFGRLPNAALQKTPAKKGGDASWNRRRSRVSKSVSPPFEFPESS